MKAASLIDIALWDIAAKQVRQPVFRMLGALRSKVPVMVVAGYYLDQRTIEDIGQEVAGLVEQGFERIKIMILGNDLAFDERFVNAMYKIAGPRICVDAHWSWNTVTEAYHTCRRIDDLGLRFIEDPFGPYRAKQTAELKPCLRLRQLAEKTRQTRLRFLNWPEQRPSCALMPPSAAESHRQSQLRKQQGWLVTAFFRMCLYQSMHSWRVRSALSRLLS